MKTFAHRYADTPHGASNVTIPVSVLLTAMFIGAQWFLHVMVMITTQRSTEVLYTNPEFTTVSAAVTVLLLGYLGVDLRRNRIEAHGARRYQYGVFAVAALLLLAYLGVDLRRNRIEAHGARRYQYGVFAVAALLLLAYLWFLSLSAG